MARAKTSPWAAILLAVLVLISVMACHVITEKEAPNLVPNPGFDLDADKDGVPDGWDMGVSTVKNIEHSRFSVTKIEGYEHKVLKVVGGQDLAGFWWCSIGSIQPYRDYILEFDVIKGPEDLGGYPRVELLGHTLVLDQIGLVGRAQHVRLKFHSAKLRGKTTFKFINNTPTAYHLGRPVLRPMKPKEYRLKLDPDVPANYRDKRLAYFPVGALGGWKDSFEELGALGFNCVVVPPDKGIIQRAHQSGLNAAIRLPGGEESQKFLKNLKASRAVLHKDDFFVLDLRPEMRGVSPKRLFGERSSLITLFPKAHTVVSLLRSRFARDFRDSADTFIVETRGGGVPLSMLSDKVETVASIVTEDRVWAMVDTLSLSPEEAGGAAFLALAHGASGLFFRMEEGKEPPDTLKGLLSRIDFLKKELLLPTDKSRPPFAMPTSPYVTDARGWPAVHTSLREEGGRWIIIAANGVDRPIGAILTSLPRQDMAYLKNLETGGSVAVRDGRARLMLGPYDALFLAAPGEAAK